MIYNKEEKFGQTVHTAKYSKDGDFVVIRDGKLEKLNFNPHTRNLVYASIYGKLEGEGRYAIYIATPSGYKQIGPRLKSRVDAMKVAGFIAASEGEAHVIDIIEDKDRKKALDPEEEFVKKNFWTG